MDAITKLLKQGMQTLAELVESQKDTDRTLKIFINSLQGRNGR